MTQAEKFQEIADKIRGKSKRTSLIIANNFAKEIDNIPVNYMDISTPMGVYYSNFDNAWEAVKLAMTYMNSSINGEKSFKYVEETGCLKGETEATIRDNNGNAIMDDSTFIGLVLRGISYHQSPYSKNNAECNPSLIECDYDKKWVEEYFDLQSVRYEEPYVFPYYEYMDQHDYLRVLTAGDMALYYDRMGFTWFFDTSYARSGDLCFLYTENDDGTLTNPDFIMGINHVGIMTDSEHYLHMDNSGADRGLIRSSIYDLQPFLYARPLYGALVCGPTNDLTPGTVDLIPDTWAGLKQGSTIIDGLRFSLHNKDVTVTSSEQTSDQLIPIISDECPLMLPAGAYKLIGLNDNTSLDKSSYEHNMFGVKVYSNGKEIPGITRSADTTNQGSREDVCDIGGGCEFVIEDYETPITIKLWLSKDIDYTNFSVEPVLYKSMNIDEYYFNMLLTDFEYVYEDHVVEITGWKGTLNGVPSTICQLPDYYGVKLGETMNFRKYSNITEISIPDTIVIENTDMSNAFYSMSNLKHVEFDHQYVSNMANMYTWCEKLIDNPSCGENVLNMYSTYYDCTNLTGSPVCGNNVKDMRYTYTGCINLTGSPVCGPNVTSMTSAYSGCTKLTDSPVCGPNVTSMLHTYEMCYNLTGDPVCGNKVTDMSYAYHSCRNLTGSPVCGNNVTNMRYTYYHCYNITGSPVCGPNVTDMYMTYYNCYKITGSPVCGNNVTYMEYAYYNCYNLTGSPVCGNKVTSMASTYHGCMHITGNPVCGPNVTNMTKTYMYCYNLTGSPVCGNKVRSMSNAYTYCSNLTGSPACGNNVTFLSNAYTGCSNLTGSPVCGANVTAMDNAYYDCYNLTGSPVCGNNVKYFDMAYYNCYNLTGSPVCGANVTNMWFTYQNCYNLYGNMYMYSPNVETMIGCFSGRNKENDLNIYVLENSKSLESCLHYNISSIVGEEVTIIDNGNNSHTIVGYGIHIYPVANVEKARIDNGD